MFITFVAIRLVPGDPVEVRVGEHGISPERLAMFRHQLGLDQPVWKQFLDYVWRLLHGDFGTSLSTSNPVLREFLTLFQATLELSFAAMLIAVIIGVPAGAIAAVKRGSAYDHILMAASVTGFSMPIFWWGLLLIMLFSERWGLTPVSGRIDLIKYYFEPVTGFMLIDAALSDQKGALLDALHHLALPAFVLGTLPLAVIARMTRSSMLEVLNEDYIRAARAKGLSPFRVVGLHALRNAMIPVVTVIGLSVGALLSGAVLTETIFSWPGVGKWLIESIFRRDYPALQGGVMLISSVVILVSLLVDLPRESRRRFRPDRPLPRRPLRHFRQLHRSLFARRTIPRRNPRASGLGRRRVEICLWDRWARPRHPLPADLRRADFPVHRSLGDGPFLPDRGRARPLRRLFRRRRRYRHLAPNRRHLGLAQPRPRHPDHRHYRTEPLQHDHRDHHRLHAELRAPDARLGHGRAVEGLRDRGAGRRRRSVASNAFDCPAKLPRALHRPGGDRRL